MSHLSPLASSQRAFQYCYLAGQRIDSSDIALVCVFPILNFKLEDNRAVIFSHILFNRFPGLCLLRGFIRVNTTVTIPFSMRIPPLLKCMRD